MCKASTHQGHTNPLCISTHYIPRSVVGVLAHELDHFTTRATIIALIVQAPSTPPNMKPATKWAVNPLIPTDIFHDLQGDVCHELCNYFYVLPEYIIQNQAVT